jgi:hypothetical protein
MAVTPETLKELERCKTEVVEACMDLYRHTSRPPSNGKRLHGAPTWTRRERLERAMNKYEEAQKRVELEATA